MILTAAPHVYLVPMVPHDVTSEFIEGMNDPEVYFHYPYYALPQTRATIHALILDNMKDEFSRLYGIHVNGDLRGIARVALTRPPVSTVIIFDKVYWGTGLEHAASKRLWEFLNELRAAQGVGKGSDLGSLTEPERLHLSTLWKERDPW